MNIEVRNFTKIIRKGTVLEDINLDFESGYIYGLTGQNGSGKTMLLRAIAGLIRPTSGEVIVDGLMLHKDISFPPNMGILIEKPTFMNYLTGYENLKFLAEIRNIVSYEKIEKYMQMFGLDPHSKKPVKKYSLGMKQKLGIIQAIMEDQQILILDEAFNALDESSVSTLRKLLQQYKNEGKLIILTSHNKEDIEVMCDYNYHISNGKILS